MPPGRITVPFSICGTSKNNGKEPKTQRVASEKIRISAKVAST